MNRAERVVESVIVEPLEWVREQGIVLQSARGPVPNLAEYVAGEPILTSQPGRVGQPGMMLTNAIRHPSAANADALQAQPAQTSGPRS